VFPEIFTKSFKEISCSFDARFKKELIPSYEDESYKWIHSESYGVVVLEPQNALFFKPNISY